MKVRVWKLRLTNLWTWICPLCLRGSLYDTHAVALNGAWVHIQNNHSKEWAGGAP